MYKRQGEGRSRGIDLFFKGSLPGGFSSRTTLSALRARRTDPNTGTLAPAPFDISSSATTIVEKQLGGVRAAVARRMAARAMSPRPEPNNENPPGADRAGHL